MFPFGWCGRYLANISIEDILRSDLDFDGLQNALL
jgi:hypothetical protein